MLAGAQLALGVLGVDSFLSAAQTGGLAFFRELTNDVVHATLPVGIRETLTARRAGSSMQNGIGCIGRENLLMRCIPRLTRGITFFCLAKRK